MTGNIKRLYDHFESEDRVSFVSISIDPTRDTPEVLAKFANTLNVATTKWHFLTGGSEEKVTSLAVEGFKLATDTSSFIQQH